MQLMTIPLLLTSDDVLMPMPELSGDCVIALGCCCKHLTVS